MWIVSRDRPALRRRDVIKALKKGLAPLTLDAELIEDLKNFVSTPKGSRIVVRGILVLRHNAPKLRILPMNIDTEVELVGMDLRTAEALYGEPMHVYGVKIGEYRLRVEDVKLRPLVRRPPPVSWEYVRDRVLNGIEVAVPEDLVVTPIASAPPLQAMGCKGGVSVALVGRGRSYLDKALRGSVISIPRVWSYRKVVARESVERFRRVAELSLNIETESEKHLARTRCDIPILIRSAQRRENVFDFDILDFAVYTKAMRPRSSNPIAIQSYVAKLAKRLATWIEVSDIPPIIVGTGRLLDLNAVGTPSSIIRLAMAMARARWVIDLEPFLDKAYTAITKAIESVIELFTSRPTKIVKLRDFEKEVLRVIEKLEPHHPDGVPVQAIAEELRLRSTALNDLYRALEVLRNRGYVYSPKPDRYRVVKL